jgi:gluconate kinase
MKKVTIEVNLEDNEVLEESVREALVGEAKKIAREQFSQILEKEIDRIAQRNAENLLNSSYWGSSLQQKINEVVRDAMSTMVSETISKEEIKETIRETVDLRIDSFFAASKIPSQINQVTDEQIKERVDAIIEQETKDKILNVFMEGLSKLMNKGGSL